MQFRAAGFAFHACLVFTHSAVVWPLKPPLPCVQVMYMVGNAIIREVVTMLDFMPAVVLTSKLCPRGMESTVYALLAGFQNFGQTVSRNIGTAALPGAYLSVQSSLPL